jgi:hypothetical protein
LIKGLGGHGATPDHGLVLPHQKTDRHELHPVVLQGFHGLAVFALGAAFDAHHHGLAGAVDVGVQNAHARTLGGQRQRQIGGSGALAHPTLARGHGNDVLDLRQQLHAALGRVRDDLAGHVSRHVVHPRHALGGGDQGLTQRRDLALGGVAQFHVKRHAGALDTEVFELLGGNEILACVGIGDGLQGLQELFGGCHGWKTCLRSRAV